jgi:hypothetical protein|tara:strand:- start:3520 stop:3696 length:177 start_codon:yes stop_codon:yes gene_type:complete
MFPKTPLTKILFLDIEMVFQYATSDDVKKHEKIYYEEKQLDRIISCSEKMFLGLFKYI